MPHHDADLAVARPESAPCLVEGDLHQLDFGHIRISTAVQVAGGQRGCSWVTLSPVRSTVAISRAGSASR